MSLAQAYGASPLLQSESGRRLPIDEGRSLIRLALPIMAIALVNMGMSLTDTAMVAGLFGTGALAAVAVGSDLYSIAFYLGAGTLAGVAPFYTAAVARADADARARLERIGWLAVALLAALTVPLLWTAPSWLERLGLDPALLATGRGYTRALALTLVPMLGVVLYRTLLTAAEKPRVFLKVTLAMLPLNAGANYVLMVGAGPIPAFGPTGAGLSSLIVATATLAVLAAIARRSRPAARPDAACDRADVLAVLRVGVPIGIATVTEVGIFLGATLYAARLGAADVAAHTLTLRIAGVAYAIPTALLQASMVRIARADSFGDARAARGVVAASLGIAFVLGVLVCLVLTLGAAPLAPAFFDASAAGLAAASLASGLIVLLGFIQFVANPSLAAAGLLRGRKDTRAPMVYVLAGNWAVGAPVGIGLCEFGGLGITGIWIGLASGMTATAILTLARLHRTHRNRPSR
jgi:multidrug resistance protein, MATE family